MFLANTPSMTYLDCIIKHVKVSFITGCSRSLFYKIVLQVADEILVLSFVSLALLRIERVRDAVKNLDRSLEESLRSQELIGSVTDVESEFKIHIKSRSVTFSWQRGIKIGKLWLSRLSSFGIVRCLIYCSNINATIKVVGDNALETVVITLCVIFELLLFLEIMKGMETRMDRNRFLEKKLVFRMY